MRLLAAEGDEADAEALRSLLESSGYRVQVVGGPAAREQGQHSQSENPPTYEQLQDQLATAEQDGAELARLARDQSRLRHQAEDRIGSLETLARLKDEFIATVSHDLKSPLASIRGYSQLLLRELQHSPSNVDLLEEGLAEIDTQTGVLIGLLDNLLDASRIQAGIFRLWRAPCALSDCLADVTPGLNPEERRRVALALPDEVLSGDWDRTRIDEVLGNLIGNALEYSPDGAPVSATAAQTAGLVEVSVRDRGIGIPAMELPRLFERFYRTPQTQATGLPGAGLGLYICQGIVGAHGGRLWAESAGEGAGATFSFTLPVNPMPAALPEAGLSGDSSGRGPQE